MVLEYGIFSKTARVPWRLIDQEIVIVDLKNNSVLQLNDVARLIWEHIDGTVSISAIIDLITEQYLIDRSTAQNDALIFVTTLLEKGLIHAISNGTEHSGNLLHA
jgi:Coenzyme PQQ synthesis protein D (PqqD)